MTTVRRLLLLLLDAAAVVAFVTLGRRTHDDGSGITAVLEVAAPFLIGLACGWAVSRAWTAPAALRTGTIVWVVTVVVGMILRRVVWDRGTAVAFVIVATVVLGVSMLGWRVVTRVLARRTSLPV